MVGDPAAHPPDVGFEMSRRGYDQRQVDEHLHRLDAQIRILSTDRDAALAQSAQLTRELDDSRALAERLYAQLGAFESSPQSVRGMSERMRSMLRLAEDEVGEMVGRAEADADRRVHEAEQRATQVGANAKAQADAVRAAAKADADSLRATAKADADSLRATAKADADAVRAAAKEEADAATQEYARVRAEFDAEQRTGAAAIAATLAEAEHDRARAWADWEARRVVVEEDFTIAMDQRRSEALDGLYAERLEVRREVDTTRTSIAAQARQIIQDARGQAQRLVSDAEHRVAELTALRRRIVEQLGGARSVLVQCLGVLDPLTGELIDAERSGADPSRAVTGPRPDPRQVGEPAAAPPNGEAPDAVAPDQPTPGPDASDPGAAGTPPNRTTHSARPRTKVIAGRR